MKCDIFIKGIKSGKDLESLFQHICLCPDCEKALEDYVNFKEIKFNYSTHPHSDFLSKFSEEPFNSDLLKDSITCPICFIILNTYQKGFKLFEKVPSKKILNKIIKAPFKEENLIEKISSIALSFILFFVITFATIAKGNLSLTFTKLQTFYVETKGKTKSFYGKLLGYGANKLKEEEKNEMYKSQ